ncbi:MAG TPA: 1,4-alpha-glucan branching protein GlgB [Gammaproteobacteria bacterium]|nr:1,4-alpha-glucan branching protein GlgB [Gammaproteobacteria bacterium]
MVEALTKIQHGWHHDPFEWLGMHPGRPGYVVRAFMPSAEHVELEGIGAMARREGSDTFEIALNRTQKEALPQHYRLSWTEKGSQQSHAAISPYSFLPVLSDFDLDLFAAGTHLHIYRFLGARLQQIDGIDGCLFAVWAPNVKRVSVVGDFNGWHGLRHPMRNRGSSGVWELFIPGLHVSDNYKFEIRTHDDEILQKTDPYARAMGVRPDTTSKICTSDQYPWADTAWITRRQQWQWLHEPMSIYEVHAGSWRRHEDGGFLGYTEMAEQLIPYVKKLGYTHIEFLPFTEHPLDESWGYQVSGYYAPTSRHGSADELRYLIDTAHQNGIGIILDWVPAHFPRDEFALARFTGEACYEYGDPNKGEHLDWGTLIFNYSRNEVRNFLVANAVYWIEEFHIDGLRVDAVASMLYLDYSREQGQWSPNVHGGREHLEAIDFLKNLNNVVHAEFPGVVTLAEESTDWPMVSRPTDGGGLGFSMKWNMGWMHDTLNYTQTDPLYRRFHQDQLTFSQIYAYSENFVLPLSHDEVVHMKRSMLDKMPGDVWQKFANLRVLYAYQYAHPGKKLLFMGGEFGQWDEWSESRQLDWVVSGIDKHAGLSNLITDLNGLYRNNPAMYFFDFDHQGFQWISCDDVDNSVLAFIRRSQDRSVICVFNFTPAPLEDYVIGVAEPGLYKEVLNTDAAWYGGTDVGNGGEVKSRKKQEHGFEHALTVTLPPLAALFLQKVTV